MFRNSSLLILLILCQVLVYANNDDLELPVPGDIFFDTVEIVSREARLPVDEPYLRPYGDYSVDLVLMQLQKPDGNILQLPVPVRPAVHEFVLIPVSDDDLYWIEHSTNYERIIHRIDLNQNTVTELSHNEDIMTGCGIIRVQDIQSYVLISDDTGYSLCEIITGNRIALPETYSVNTYPYPSPDSSLIAFSAGFQENERQFSSIIIFDTGSEEFYAYDGFYIGAGSQNHYQWLDNDYLLLTNFNQGNRNHNDGRTTILDLNTQEVLYTMGPVRVNTLPELQTNPLRLVGHFTEFDAESGDYVYNHCYTESYYLESREIETVDYGPFCYPHHLEWDTIAYYLVDNRLLQDSDPDIIYRDEAYRDEQIALVKYNPATGTGEVLYASAIEQLRGISEPEALLILSETDIAQTTFTGRDGSGPGDNYTGRLVIVNLETGDIIEESDAYWQAYPMSSWSLGTRYGEARDSPTLSMPSALPDDSSMRSIRDGWLLVTNYDTEEYRATYSLYHREAQQLIPIAGISETDFADFSESDYIYISIDYSGDNIFEISFQMNNDTLYGIHDVHYVIRLIATVTE